MSNNEEDIIINKRVSKKNKQALLQLRRDRVIQLRSRGYTIRDIAKDLGVSASLVNKDVTWLRHEAQKNLKEYVNRILPDELQHSIVRLQDLITEAWKDIADPQSSKKDKHSAIQLVKECTELKLEIIGGGVLANELNSSNNNSNDKDKDSSKSTSNTREQLKEDNEAQSTTN
jgi:transposase-like protein